MFESGISLALLSIAGISIVGFLSRNWIKARLKASIEHEYKKQFELFQRELNQKQKVELVAELLAEWARTPHGETVPREQRTLLNKLSFQASLWLPSELAIELGKRLQNKSDAKSQFEIILIARRLLIGDASLSLGDVTWWEPSKENRADPIFHHG